MRMNRRNVLLGLGTIVAGGGAVLGSGAFSRVQADRTVTVETVGDRSAYLGISVNGPYAADGSDSGDAAEIDLGDSSTGDGFNDDAETVVDGILTLANNTADGSPITVGFDDGSGDQTATTTVVVETDGSGNVRSEVQLSLADDDGSGDQYTLSDGATVDVNATVRTGRRTTDSAGEADKDGGTLTLIAN
ncbi:hypothetical protein [Salinilacihabitans rarus]|uniref:hypothetical protein n=1 Tax=Salinilacihabitans rarus TaxID=2961596 RepID=UPI0020C901E4|nr:hypothetical protein [Salinilacihabitans rarus]